MVGEKPLQLTEEPHRDILEGEERPPPRLEGQDQEQHEVGKYHNARWP